MDALHMSDKPFSQTEEFYELLNIAGFVSMNQSRVWFTNGKRPEFMSIYKDVAPGSTFFWLCSGNPPLAYDATLRSYKHFGRIMETGEPTGTGAYDRVQSYWIGQSDHFQPYEFNEFKKWFETVALKWLTDPESKSESQWTEMGIYLSRRFSTSTDIGA